jgi:lipopolysaccharide transport system ATP-binding protein
VLVAQAAFVSGRKRFSTALEKMSEVVIKVEGLSKRYRIGTQQQGNPTLREKLNETALGPLRAARRVFPRNGNGNVASGTGQKASANRNNASTIWALKDVSFKVQRGEVVGIIGRNGAGKSTLLKILSRITEPTDGYADITGRLASLLEVGTGFHPELTGRENIFLNGSILGMRGMEIRSKFDEIVAFSEVEKFIDTPVKYYSSGMYVRLAFAVAAHLDPEILLVDEVLAVGDAGFQKKCLGKIGDVAKEGRTVLFVSHNMGAVTSLCDRAIWLDEGKIQLAGATRSIINKYLSLKPSHSQTIDLTRATLGSSKPKFQLRSLTWLTGIPPQHGATLRARVEFDVASAVEDITVGIGFSSLEGVRLLTYETDYQDGFRPSLDVPGRYSVECEIDSLPLAPATYALDVGCRSGDGHALDYLPSIAQIAIIPGPTTPGYIVRQDAGVRLQSIWSWFEPEVNKPVAH